MAPIDSNIAKVLGVDPALTLTEISSIGGGCSSATASKLTITLNGEDEGRKRVYFLKTASGKDAKVMFEGECASLSAINAAVPSLCPKPYGWGKLADNKQFFLITQYLDLSRASTKRRSGESGATKLARLHTTPAPIPEGHDTPMFGFSVSTCCGDTVQENTFSSSWAEFFTEYRLRFILKECRRNNGTDRELEKAMNQVIDKVVPRLIGDDHLNNGEKVMPVVVHGDLWSGNKGWGRILDDTGELTEDGEVIFDPSACFAHNEYELGIMNMFGGFGSQFMDEYHIICPKTEPVEEYKDRVALYELYHHLNHNALFGGGYRSGAMRIMTELIRRYGETSERI